MKKLTQIVLVSLFAAIFTMFYVGCPNDTPQENEANREVGLQQRDAKIYSKATIEDDFDDSSLVVVLDNLTGGVNKKHDESFFGEFEKEYVQDITVITDYFETIDRELFRQIFEIKLPKEKAGKEQVLSAIRMLERIEGILYAGPNYSYNPAKVPNDWWYSGYQWGLDGGFNYGIQAQDAWEITTGSSSVSVGIIDTGIAIHPDLELNVDRTLGRYFSSNNSNSTMNCINWYCSHSSCNDTYDTKGHGTHIAGIIGAVGNNNNGITGVCWKVKLVPLKTDFYTVGLVNAINYARNKGIKVLNCSWGDEYNDPALYNVISMYWNDILFICAAGNESKENTYWDPIYPSSYNHLTNLISVGSIDQFGWISSFSNYSFQYVDIFAPGGKGDAYFSSEDILSTFPPALCDMGINVCAPYNSRKHLDRGYHYMAGTSMATPYVSGVAALMLSANSKLTPSQIKQIIKQSVDSGPFECTSGGRLNAYKALKASVTTVNIRSFQLPAPATGAAPTRTIDTAQYTGSVEWYPNHTAFVSGTYYIATITLKAKDGYTLHGVTADNYFTVTGSSLTLYDASSGKVTADMGIPLFGGGAGTQANPYLIKTTEHLNNIRLFPDGHFRLENDIIFHYSPNVNNWTPIPEFRGSLNGAGYKISNIKIKANTSDTWGYGLVTLNIGIIRNLVIEGCIEMKANAYAGMFAGTNAGTISQCYSQPISICPQPPMINTIFQSSQKAVGGIVGLNLDFGIIELCGNYGDLRDFFTMGGISGINYGTIDRSFNSGTIIFSYNAINVKMGGIAGVQDAAYHQKGISSSQNNGLIKYGSSISGSTTLQPHIAQIVGNNVSGYLRSNGWTGTVDKGLLRVYGNHDQALYVGNREVGR